MRRKELTDYPFNKESFREVIIKARGDRSQAEFAQDCDLSYAYLNKYANGKLSDAPTIGTIKKISVATKTVSYEELLTAAGYDAEKYKDDRPVGASRKDFSIRYSLAWRTARMTGGSKVRDIRITSHLRSSLKETR